MVLKGVKFMKLAIDGRGINWYNGSGIGTYTENLLKNLLNIDRNNFYQIYWSGENYESYQKENTNLVMCSKKYQRFFQDNFFPEDLKRENIDLYHIPQNGIGLTPEVHCKTVVTIHDLIPYIMPETVGRGYLLKFLKEMPYIAEASNGIITVSEYSKQDILRFFPIDESKVFVTPLAADKKYMPLDKELCKNIIKEKYDIDLSKSYAYGDTSGDLTMFKSVGNPYAINPTKELISKIIENEEVKNKINVIVERKDVIYKLDINNLELI